MLTLRKRLSEHDRVGKVTVIDMLNDPSSNNVPYYLVMILGKDKYLHLCQQCEVFNQYWVVIDEETKEYSVYESFLDIRDKYKSFKMFTKRDRSSFKYWFAHWCGFQLTALNLGIWKLKYLLHDVEKPWLKLLCKGDYKKVQKWHRYHNNHHLEYGLEHGWDNIDWEALMIDWECCGLSKQEAQLDARETMEYEVKKDKWKPYETDIRNHLEPLLYTHNL